MTMEYNQNISLQFAQLNICCYFKDFSLFKVSREGHITSMLQEICTISMFSRSLLQLP